MKLSIIIVSWNVQDKLQTNLTVLFKSQLDFSFEVILVDNNSSDSSVVMLKKKFPQVKLIVNPANFGFARANNQAIKLAQGDFILLLNPDMRVKGDTFKNIIAWAENNPQAVVSGCKLLNEHGTIVKQIRRFPTLIDQLLIVYKIPHIFPGVIRKYLNYKFNYNQASKVDSIRGSFFLINRSAYKKISQPEPFLDERYFVWFEEVDFCRQVYELGGEVWYTPTAECFDYIGQSFQQVSRKKTQKYFSVSMLKYFQKWGKRWQYLLLKISWWVVSALTS